MMVSLLHMILRMLILGVIVSRLTSPPELVEAAQGEPEISVTISRNSLNEVLSNFRGATLTKTWNTLAFRPSLTIELTNVKIISMNSPPGTIRLMFKGIVQFQYFILNHAEQSTVDVTVIANTRPFVTPTAMLLTIVKADIQVRHPRIPGQIELLPIEELIRAVLLPEQITLFDLRTYPGISMPVPGKKSVTLKPTAPQVILTAESITLSMTVISDIDHSRVDE